MPAYEPRDSPAGVSADRCADVGAPPGRDRPAALPSHGTEGEVTRSKLAPGAALGVYSRESWAGQLRWDQNQRGRPDWTLGQQHAKHAKRDATASGKPLATGTTSLCRGGNNTNFYFCTFCKKIPIFLKIFFSNFNFFLKI